MRDVIQFLQASAPFAEMCATTTLRPLYDLQRLSPSLPGNVCVCGEERADIDIRDSFVQVREGC